MAEDLLGYLLGALDAAEHRRIEKALDSDPELRQQLEGLRRELKRLGQEADRFEPPTDLVERTCERVEAYKRHQRATPAAVHGKVWFAGRRWGAPERASGARTWSMVDVLVMAGILLVGAMLFFPAIANSRYHARIAACQNNLQHLGVALADYSDKNGGVLPQIPVSGKRSIAGIYGPILVEQQFLTESNRLVCPASHLAERDAEWRVPRLAELDRAEGLELMRLQRTAGGSYGYSLGYVADGQYRAPRYEGRANYAIMSDAPSLHLPGHRSDNHGGRGQNVLFEDNRVEFVTRCVVYDALFLNRDGFTAAGLDDNDSVIGRSATPPFMR